MQQLTSPSRFSLHPVPDPWSVRLIAPRSSACPPHWRLPAKTDFACSPVPTCTRPGQRSPRRRPLDLPLAPRHHTPHLFRAMSDAAGERASLVYMGRIAEQVSPLQPRRGVAVGGLARALGAHPAKGTVRAVLRGREVLTLLPVRQSERYDEMVT